MATETKIRTKTIHIYVPVCVTMVVNAETGELLSQGATSAYVDYEGMPWSENEGDMWDCQHEQWSNNLLGANGVELDETPQGQQLDPIREASITMIEQALQDLDYPDADMQATEDA